MKYKVEKIFIKNKTLSDDSDKISLIRGTEKEIVRIFDNKDLEKKLNDLAKQGWELVHIESNTDYESKIMEKDAKYFENLDYNLNFDKDDIQDVFRLRELWVNTDDNESKEFVFKSLQDLYYYAHLLGY